MTAAQVNRIYVKKKKLNGMKTNTHTDTVDAGKRVIFATKVLGEICVSFKSILRKRMLSLHLNSSMLVSTYNRHRMVYYTQQLKTRHTYAWSSQSTGKIQGDMHKPT